MPQSPDRPRRVVRRKVPRKQKKIPILSELHQNAYEAGMTVREYVNFMTSLNMKRTNRRNYSASYDMGEEPWRKKK